MLSGRVCGVVYGGGEIDHRCRIVARGARYDGRSTDEQVYTRVPIVHVAWGEGEKFAWSVSIGGAWAAATVRTLVDEHECAHAHVPGHEHADAHAHARACAHACP